MGIDTTIQRCSWESRGIELDFNCIYWVGKEKGLHAPHTVPQDEGLSIGANHRWVGGETRHALVMKARPEVEVVAPPRTTPTDISA